MATKKIFSGFPLRSKVIITCSGRLKGEIATVIGETNLNMDHRVIVYRENPRARDKTMGFSPSDLKKVAEKTVEMGRWECKECLEGIETEVRPCVFDIGRKVDVGENWEGPDTCPISGTDCNWQVIEDKDNE